MALWSGNHNAKRHSFMCAAQPEDLLEEVGFSTDDAAALRKVLRVTQHRVSEVSEPGNQRPVSSSHIPLVVASVIEGNPLPEENVLKIPPAQQRQIIYAGFHRQ